MMDHLIDDSDRLKPCPFCGGEAEMIDMPEDSGDVTGAKFVQCTNSACMASSALIYPLMDDAKHLLLERWNKRADIALRIKTEEHDRCAEDLIALRAAANALLHQIDINDFTDSNGHAAKMLKATHDLMRVLGA